MNAYDISKAKTLLTDLVRDGLVYGDDSDILQKVLDNLNHFSGDKSIGYRIDHKKSGFNMTCSVCGYDIPDSALYCPGCGGKVIGEYTKTARDEYRIDTYLYNHDSDDICKFCIHQSDCPGGVTGGPNGPIYPPCADGEPNQYLDYEELLDNLDQDGNLKEDTDSDAVKEIKDAIEEIGQKYLYQFMDPTTLATLEHDVHDLVAKLSYKYSIYNNGYTIYINDAPTISMMHL